MADSQHIADQIAARARDLAYQGKLATSDVPLINALANAIAARYPAPPPSPAPAPIATPAPGTDPITPRVAAEIIFHEAIVLEWYKDSVGVGTWGIGVTDKSGHAVGRYKDHPQSIEHVLEVFLWLLRTSYAPDVQKAFKGMMLTENQFAAALSFHYNTGAILRTDWVKMVLAGDRAGARKFLTSHYLNGGDLQKRRNQEAALFFDGVWSSDGTTTIWPVKRPSYTPDWRNGMRVNIMGDLAKAMAA